MPRGTSATADAYLTPEIKRYIAGFNKGFEGDLGNKAALQGRGTRCEFMQSDGGLVDVSKFSGLRAILSGPAGGVVGYALTSYDPETKIPVIGFDMGGTSTGMPIFGVAYFRCISICREIRACFRNYDSGSYYSEPSVRYQYGSCWRWISTLLEERLIRRRS